MDELFDQGEIAEKMFGLSFVPTTCVFNDHPVSLKTDTNKNDMRDQIQRCSRRRAHVWGYGLEQVRRRPDLGSDNANVACEPILGD